MSTFNPTKNTWDQVANKQSFDEITSGNLNSKTLIVEYDPIYNKLVQQISYTMYRKLRIMQKWERLGRTAPENAYPGILREIFMAQRKGMNYPFDNQVTPTTLNSYDIIDDEIETRYHAAQFRWLYGWTIFDEILRRYSGGNGMTIAELTEMKFINAVNARNMFMDALRKETLFQLISNVAIPVNIPIDITDFDNLTQAQAQSWFNAVDNILFEMSVGTALYNALGAFIQVPKSDLQLIMPRAYFMNILRRAFPDTYHTESFENILPENLILIDTLGGDTLMTAGTTAAQPTFDAKGMNLLNWTKADSFTMGEPDTVAVIMHRDCIGFEDNLNATLFGPKDIEKLATPVRSHFWTKAYYTDMLPVCKIIKTVVKKGGE